MKQLLKIKDNKICADCKRNDARWASTNLGCFICIRCSGVHRGLGVHISRSAFVWLSRSDGASPSEECRFPAVKSVDLDTWMPDQIAVRPLFLK